MNEYQWGNFKGDPTVWMEKYFDAFFYLANWGTRQFMLRLPARALDIADAQCFCCGDSAVARRKGESVILAFHSDDEDGEWADGADQLSALIPLRSDLVRGDHRCLYLAWLLCVQAGEIDDDEKEPPVPRGLRTLTGPLDAFAEIMTRRTARSRRGIGTARRTGSGSLGDSPDCLTGVMVTDQVFDQLADVVGEVDVVGEAVDDFVGLGQRRAALEGQVGGQR